MMLLIILFNSKIISQNNLKKNDSIIIWSSKIKLSWSDFKSQDRKIQDAGSSVGLSISYIRKKNNVTFNVYSIFEKYHSYVFLKSDYLLNHEQLHFDIVELYAKKLRKKFLLLKEKKAHFNDYILVFKKIKDSLDKEQNQYDCETSHSKNKVVQMKWNKIILNKLKELEPYSHNNYLDSIKK